jgi:lysozyme
MIMKTSQFGLEFIARWEGMCYKPYKDVAGLRTIGVGHLILPTDNFPDGVAITKERAYEILAVDVEKCETAIAKAIKVPLNQNQYDALVSFGFNCGTGVYWNSAICISLNVGNYSAVPNGLMAWNRARINGVLTPVQGLTNRRKEEGELFAKPVFDSSFIMWDENIMKDVQEKLKKLNLYGGKVDGIWGPKTEFGIMSFAKANSLPETIDDWKYGISRELMECLDDKSK